MLTVVHLIEDVPREFDTAAFEIDDNGTLIILDHSAGQGMSTTPRVVAAFAAGSWGAVVPKAT
ncbi:hypothetical protein [Corynebacterium freneyi]|uniref:hypothetical protein n=1 Tax=Corynebacterium freneyi TaxID=134034 RepID=UPI001CC92245|nr:hypothetical protein [Corynebacterium freneyi]UBI01563.1 hypothetical protein LA334_08505 [Corynebacterium freneyi]